MSAIELLPCPFCGGKDTFHERGDLTVDYRVCNTCLAHGPMVEADGAYEKRNGDAIMDKKTLKAWNRRTAMQAAIDAAKLAEFFDWIVMHKAGVLASMSRREQAEFTELLGAARVAQIGAKP